MKRKLLPAVLLISAVLIFACFSFPDLVFAAADNTAPTVNSVSFQTTTVQKPGTVTLSLDVTEEDTGIVSLSLALYTYNNNQLVTIFKDIDYISMPQYTGTLSAAIPISAADYAGNYYIGSIRITDQAGNSRSYFNGWPANGYSTVGTSNYIPCFGDEAVKCMVSSAGIVTVLGNPADDVTAPLINSITVQTPTVQTSGSVTLSLDITEQDTGIDWLSLALYTYNNGQLVTISRILDFTAIPTFSGKISVDIPVPSTAFAGDYFIDSIRITDKAGNARNYSNGWSAAGYCNDGTNNYLPSFSDSSIKCIMSGAGLIKVSGNAGADITAPTVNNISVQTLTIQKPGIVTLSLNVTEEGTGIVSLGVNLYSYNNGQLVTVNKMIDFRTQPRYSGTIRVEIPVSSTVYAGNY